MTLVAVAKHTRIRGVPSENAPLDAYEQLELVHALERTWPTDAHCVLYIADGFRAKQPRLKKEAVDYRARTTTFMCDLDNPGHALWTSATRADAIAFDAEHLASEGVYHTTKGRRLVQPLHEPIDVRTSEPYLRRWLLELEQRGYAVDWACKDWTRHFRLPHVRRDGVTFRSPIVDLSRMRPIALEPLPELPAFEPAPRARPRRAGGGASVAFTATLPATWRAHVAPLAEAIGAGVTSNWHDMYLALAGALLRRNIPPEHVPGMIRAIAQQAASVKPESHEKSARDTVRRFLDGLPITGFSDLALRWSSVAHALERCMLAPSLARTSPAPTPTLSEATTALEDTIRRAPEGLTVIAAECGLGKTYAAQRVALERARKLTVVDERRPRDTKTSISVDKNELARQIVDELERSGIRTRRLFGPLSVEHADGTKECRFAEAAAPLVAGGQSLQWEFCLGRGRHRCPYYDECTARTGAVGPSDARITVGTHPLLTELDQAAGTTGILIVDEPPPVLDTERITSADIDAALSVMGSFEARFSTAMSPVLFAIREWIDDHPDLSWIDVTDTIDVSNAFDPEARSHAPPIRHGTMFMVRGNPGFARIVGRVSRVLGVLYRALRSPATARLDEDHNVLVTLPNDRLAASLRRIGPVVITDANAELNVDIYARIVGYQPRFQRFAAADGAPVERTLLRTSRATRRGWLAHGRLVTETGVLGWIRRVFEWAGPTATLGLITFRVLEVLVRGIVEPHDVVVDKQWAELGQLPRVLAEARLELAALAGRRVHLAHYGATRGLNTMRDVDAIATLGDPWPNLGDVRNGADFLQSMPDARAEAMARAELEQAHGRLRSIHRQRSARALHVGAVIPSGSGWASGDVRVEQAPPGRPRNVEAMTPAELASIVEELGGARRAGAALRMSHTAINRYLRGERAITDAVASAARAAVSNVVDIRKGTSS